MADVRILKEVTVGVCQLSIFLCEEKKIENVKLYLKVTTNV